VVKFEILIRDNFRLRGTKDKKMVLQILSHQQNYTRRNFTNKHFTNDIKTKNPL
jgi:hypothetical protein